MCKETSTEGHVVVGREHPRIDVPNMNPESIERYYSDPLKEMYPEVFNTPIYKSTRCFDQLTVNFISTKPFPADFHAVEFMHGLFSSQYKRRMSHTGYYSESGYEMYIIATPRWRNYIQNTVSTCRQHMLAPEFRNAMALFSYVAENSVELINGSSVWVDVNHKLIYIVGYEDSPKINACDIFIRAAYHNAQFTYGI